MKMQLTNDRNNNQSNKSKAKREQVKQKPKVVNIKDGSKNNREEQNTQDSNIIKEEKNKDDKQNGIVKIVKIKNKQIKQEIQTDSSIIDEDKLSSEEKISNAENDQKERNKDEEQDSILKTIEKKNNQEEKNTQANTIIVEESENDKQEEKNQSSIIKKENKDSKHGKPVINSELKQENDKEQNFNITGISDRIGAKEKKVLIIRKVINDLKEQKSYKQVFGKIIEVGDENIIITVARNLNYFTSPQDNQEKMKEIIIDILIFECCSQGKIDILKKLQSEFKINFSNFSREIYERNQKFDLLTTAAKNQQLAIIKFLLENESLFLREQKDVDAKLITCEKITEQNIDFQIPFMQFVLESNYDQNVKLGFTKILLDFVKNNCLVEEKALITNYIIHNAVKHLAYEALNYATKYAKDNKLEVEISKQGMFSDSNVKPSIGWNYEKHNNKDLVKTIEKFREFDFPQYLHDEFKELLNNKDSYTKKDFIEIFNKFIIIVKGEDKCIEALLEYICDNNNQQANVIIAGATAEENH